MTRARMILAFVLMHLLGAPLHLFYVALSALCEALWYGNRYADVYKRPALVLRMMARWVPYALKDIRRGHGPLG